MVINGIPDSIPRARVVELVKSLGIDPGQLAGFEFTWYTIYVDLYATKDGARYWDGGADNKAATHRIAIAIADDAPQPRT